MPAAPDPTPPIAPVALIPRPGELRDRLARTLRDVQLLRRLLRIAEDAARADGGDADGTTPRPGPQEAGRG